MAEPHLVSGSRIDDAHPLAVEFQNVITPAAPIYTEESPPDAGGQAAKTVAATGVPERLAAVSTPTRAVLIQALRTNTGVVAIGFSNAVRTTNAPTLQAGESMSVAFQDITNIWVDVAVNGQGVVYVYVV